MGAAAGRRRHRPGRRARPASPRRRPRARQPAPSAADWHVHRRPAEGRLCVDAQDERRSSLRAGDLVEVRIAALDDANGTCDRGLLIRRPSSKPRCSRSTIGPGRCGPWWAASASRTASSTGRSRRAGNSDRRSSRSSTLRRSPGLHAGLDADGRAGRVSGRVRDSRSTPPRTTTTRSKGPITLRYALEESRNVPTVRLLDQLGPRTAISYAKRLGFSEEFQPYLHRARRDRSDAAGGDQRLHRVPEPGRAHVCDVLARAGSRRQPARGEPARAA